MYYKSQRGPKVVFWVLGGLLMGAVFALLFGLIVMWLWNWLMPELFNLPVISYWQAWGLVVLSHILFKSFPHHSNHKNKDDEWKIRMKTKFKSKYDKKYSDCEVVNENEKNEFTSEDSNS